jgi:peptidase E
MLLLMGGGGKTLLPGLDWLTSRVGQQGSILVVPHAWPTSRFDECLATMEELFGQVGVSGQRLEMAEDLHAAAAHFRRCAAVYLCGGNTFALLAAIRASQVISQLDAYRRSGGIVAGNSAGAIVMGRSIHHAHDRNDAGLQDSSGCDWVAGLSVWCHYSPIEHDREIEHLMLARGLAVLALSDESAVTIPTDNSHFETCPGATAPLIF